MEKATCIHICAAKNSADIHNKREKELDYVREELEKDLPPEKWRWEDPLYKSVASLRKQCEKEYYAKELTVEGKHGAYITHRAMPKTAEPVKEGVVVIKPDTTMEQLREFADWCHGKYGIKPMGIYIHYGEGHWATLDEKAGQSEDGYRREDGAEWKRQNKLGEWEYWKPNLHAHIVFDWFNHETGRCYRLGRRDMSEMEDKLAETLQMKRGKSSNRDWLNTIAYKSQKEAERDARDKQRRQEELKRLEGEKEKVTNQLNGVNQEFAKAQKRVRSLETMIANLEDQKAKGEGDMEELERKLEDKKAKLEKAVEVAQGLQRKIDEMYNELDKVKFEVGDAERQLSVLRYDCEEAQKEYGELFQAKEDLSKKVLDSKLNYGQNMAYHLYTEAFQQVMRDFIPVFNKLPEEGKAMLDGTLISELAEKGSSIVNLGVILMCDTIDSATTFAESHGGGGGGGGDDFKRNDDDDDRKWAARCLAMARQMMRPAPARQKKR